MTGKDPLRLRDLRSVGPATLTDLGLLGVADMADLANRNPQEMYEALCKCKGKRVDICCLDVFRCIVAQARDPQLPPEQRDWFWWSRQRKSAAS